MTSTTSRAQATPDAIVNIAVGYMGAKQLFAANRIGLFRRLAEGPLDAAGLAFRLGVTERMARILADSMNALHLVDREDGKYSLSPDAAAFLAGDSAELDLGSFLTFLGDISYPHWEQFDTTVDTDKPGQLDLSGSRLDTFMAGVMTYNELHAKMLAQQFDFTVYRRLLDLGGLSGAFSVAALRANFELEATLVFDPRMIGSVAEELAARGFAGRSRVVEAETVTAEPEGDFDLIMVNHVLHRFTAEENSLILRHARAAAAPGARLVVLDFFLDDGERQRRLDALHAGEYLVIDGTVVYPESDVRAWLTDSGWRPLETVALPGSPRIILAEAV